MKRTITVLSTLCLLLSASATQAVPVVGEGGGYYGSITWDTSTEQWPNSSVTVSLVGPHDSYYVCNEHFESVMAHNIAEHSWQVTSFVECAYRPPYAIGEPGKYDFGWEITSDDPAGSFDEVIRILDQIRLIRHEFNADEYEAALRRIR